MQPGVEPDDDGPRLAEPTVRQILDALLANALPYGTGVVRLRVRRGPGAVTIDVGDEGGARLDATTIFERTRRPFERHRLALARTLAEAEGGRLVLDRPGPNGLFSADSSVTRRVTDVP